MRYCRVDVHEGEKERVWLGGTFVVGEVKGVDAEWGNEMDWVDGSVHY